MQITRRPMRPEERARLEGRTIVSFGASTVVIPALAIGTGVWLASLVLFGTVARRLPIRPRVGVVFGLLAASMAGAFWYFARRLRHQETVASHEASARYAADLEAGEVEEWRVGVREAIEVEEFEDEGLQYYVELEDGRVLFLMGQYLYEYEDADLFPNREILLTRLPHAGDVLDLKCLGESFDVSATLPSFTPEQHEAGVVPQDGDILEGPISRFKRG